MQLITPALTAILKSRLQAGPDGFRARIEVDATAYTEMTCPLSLSGRVSASISDQVYVAPGLMTHPITPVAGSNSVIIGAMLAANYNIPPDTAVTGTGGFTTVDSDNVPAGHPATASIYKAITAAAGSYDVTASYTPGYSPTGFLWAVAAFAFETDATAPVQSAVTYSSTGAPSAAVLAADPTPGNMIVMVVGTRTQLVPFTGADFTPMAASWTLAGYASAGVDMAQIWITCVQPGDGRSWGVGANGDENFISVMEWPVTGSFPGLTTLGSDFKIKRVSIDKSLTLDADQAEVELANEDLVLGWGLTSVFLTNSRCRIYQWYGDPTNEVRAFTGLIDLVTDARDILTTTITARDMMAILIDQTFGATAPQGVDEDGAVRTMANGVFLNCEVSYIVSAILDQAGWPTADRAITETSYVLDEYVIPDGTSWSAAIMGDAVLTGLVGYSAWADEFGVFHFAPTYTAGALTAPGVPVYTFTSGVDITSLDDTTEQMALRTRVKIRGPLTTQTLTDTWRELWRTSKFANPVGLWYDPSDSANLRVIDSGTKRIYTLRQSDRAVLTYSYLGTVIPYPVGLSGDPSDASVYWVLNCPWFFTGATTGNSVKKVRKSDNVVLASYALPNGRWTAVKVSAAYIWLTNYDTDLFYSRSKTDASAVASYSHTYGGVTQVNPTGIMVDGTTLYVFWRNAGTTARFLVCSESAPGTITKAVLTAGTQLVGGEMDVTTHVDCFGDSNALGLVAKFTLVDVASMTNEVYAEVVDTALEDELGALAQSENREHDAHPTDADHPFEVRRDTVDVTVVTSLAQATETAMRRLEILSKRHRVLDAGILGNPALQKTDLVRVEDPVTGIASDFTIDTYRAEMGDTYLGTLALIPVDEPTDTPTDTGDAT